MKILLGTGNKNKVKELKEIIDTYQIHNIDIVSLKDMDFICDEPVENGKTFLENAMIKAKYYYNQYHLPVICEDTGLKVKVLNNAPGIFTARYGGINGEHADPEKNMAKLLLELKDYHNLAERSCEFETSMVYYDGNILVTSRGIMQGCVYFEKKGIGGFGYDPIFYLPEYQKTVAELGEEIKNHLSHRYHATNHLIKQLINYKIIK